MYTRKQTITWTDEGDVLFKFAVVVTFVQILLGGTMSMSTPAETALMSEVHNHVTKMNQECGEAPPPRSRTSLPNHGIHTNGGERKKKYKRNFSKRS